MLLVLAIFCLLALLTPVAGADSRDGLDWAANHFWLRRSGSTLKKTGNPGSASAGRAGVDGCRTAPTAG